MTFPHRIAFPYRNRREAGRELARLLAAYRDRTDVIVIGLPRGGVPVGHEISQRLHVPLDAIITRKLGVPRQRELAMGAIASGGVTLLCDEIVNALRIPHDEIERVRLREVREIARREAIYRDQRPIPELTGKTVILADDGLATGSTMRAAVCAVRKQSPARIVMAVPVAPAITRDLFHSIADEVVCPHTPEPFIAVGVWYDEFLPVSDAEVHLLLSESAPALELAV